MVDSIVSGFLCHGRFRSDAQPRTRRSKAEEPSVTIHDPEIASAEANDVTAALVLDETNRLAGQGLADEHEFGAPLDRSIATNAPHMPAQ